MAGSMVGLPGRYHVTGAAGNDEPRAKASSAARRAVSTGTNFGVDTEGRGLCGRFKWPYMPAASGRLYELLGSSNTIVTGSWRFLTLALSRSPLGGHFFAYREARYLGYS